MLFTLASSQWKFALASNAGLDARTPLRRNVSRESHDRRVTRPATRRTSWAQFARRPHVRFTSESVAKLGGFYGLT